MKNTRKNFTYLITILLVFLAGCTKLEDPTTGKAQEGGLIEVQTGTIVYFLDTQDSAYAVNLKYYQGRGNDIEKIDIYKQFFTLDDTGATVSSNKVLFKTINLSDKTMPGLTSYTASFDELVQGLTIDGTPIPTSDADMKPGFFWELTYDIILKDGRHVVVPANTVFLNSRFAGVYNVVDALYFRLGVLTYELEDWPSEVTLTALNANTFKMEPPCEPFGTNAIYLTIDDAGTVSILKSFGGSELTINNQKVATCSTEPGAFNSVPCDGSNVAIKMASTKDSIKLTYGYVTPTGAAGPREFWQVMVKQ